MRESGSAAFAIIVLVVIILFAGVAYVFIESERVMKQSEPMNMESPSPLATLPASVVPTTSPAITQAENSTATPTSKPTPKPSAVSTPIPVKTFSVTLKGKVYKDVNCNEILEEGETGISNLSIDIDQTPNYVTLAKVKSDANGDYSFNKTLNENETISLGAGVVAPEGYKIHGRYEYSNLNKNFPSVTINIPLVPIESINEGKCSAL